MKYIYLSIWLLFLLFFAGCSEGDIFTAIEKGKLDRVETILKEKPELLSQRDAYGRFPLHAAAAAGQREIAEFLIDKGADVNKGAVMNWDLNEANWTPLMHAARQGNADIVRLLVDNGAEIDAVSSSGRTALVVAIDWEKAAVARFLVSKGANLSFTLNGSTLLHSAAYEGMTEIVQILISRGLDINAVNARGNTPLHMTLYHDSVDTALLLLKKGARLDIANTNGETPADIGIRRGNPLIVRFLLTLHRAVERGDVKEVERLAADNPQLIDVRDDLGWTPLHHAVINNRLDIAEVLLEKGAGLNIKSKHRSIHTLRGVVGKLLVPKSSRVKLFQDKRTPLEVAVQLENREMVELLEKFAARAN